MKIIKQFERKEFSSRDEEEEEKAEKLRRLEFIMKRSIFEAVSSPEANSVDGEEGGEDEEEEEQDGENMKAELIVADQKYGHVQLVWFVAICRFCVGGPR